MFRGYFKSAPEFVYVACLLAFFAGLAICNGGCSSVQSARETLATTSRIVSVADVAESAVYKHVAAQCLDDSDSAEEYAACIGPHDAIEEAAVAVRSSLLVWEASIDAYEAGASDGLYAAAPCVLVALTELVEAIERAGAPLPPEVGQGISLLRALAPGECVHEGR